MFVHGLFFTNTTGMKLQFINNWRVKDNSVQRSVKFDYKKNVKNVNVRYAMSSITKRAMLPLQFNFGQSQNKIITKDTSIINYKSPFRVWRYLGYCTTSTNASNYVYKSKEDYNKLISVLEQNDKFDEIIQVSLHVLKQLDQRIEEIQNAKQDNLLVDALLEKANTLNNLATAEKNRNSIQTAAEYAKKCLFTIQSLYTKSRTSTEISKRSGEIISDLTIANNNLGSLYTSLYEFDKAEKHLKAALDLSEKEYGKQSYNNGAILGNLASLNNLQGNFERAEHYLKQAHSILLRHHGTEQHIEISNSLNNLGAMYMFLQNFDKAEKSFLKALEIRKRIYNLESDDQRLEKRKRSIEELKSLDTGLNLDFVQPEVENHEENYDFQQKVERIAQSRNEQATGTQLIDLNSSVYDHPDIASTLNNLAECFKETERLDLAELYYTKALKIWIKHFGETNINVSYAYYSLGSLYVQLRRIDEAEQMFKQALSGLQISLGLHHPHVITAMNNLADFYKSHQLLHKAEDLYLNLVQLRIDDFEKYSTENIPSTSSSSSSLPASISAVLLQKEKFIAFALFELGSFYSSVERLEDAEETLLRAYNVFGSLLSTLKNNSENGQVEIESNFILMLEAIGDLYQKKSLSLLPTLSADYPTPKPSSNSSKGKNRDRDHHYDVDDVEAVHDVLSSSIKHFSEVIQFLENQEQIDVLTMNRILKKLITSTEMMLKLLRNTPEEEQRTHLQSLSSLKQKYEKLHADNPNLFSSFSQFVTSSIKSKKE